MKILVVDDEQLLVKGMKFNLENEGYTVETAYDGATAIDMAKSGGFDLIILDLMMPQVDGLTACMRIREFSNVPIIMLTARSEDADKIIGLESGADDYITKPFNILELKARIRALLRRANAAPQQKQPETLLLTAGGITLDPEQRVAVKNGEIVELTAKEYDLIELLVKNPRRVYSRENLMDLVWGYTYAGDYRTVDVHIRRLREKLEENPAAPQHLLNTYPLITSENLTFRSKQSSLQGSVSVMVTALSGLEELSEENVAGAMTLVEETGISRVLVTDASGRVLYDTRETDGAIGRYAFYTELVQALRGEDVFYTEFSDKAFKSRAASPVIYHSQTIGAVYAYEYDTEQAELLLSLQRNLLTISAVVLVFAGGISVLLSRVLTRRFGVLTDAIRKMREGSYSHRAEVGGHDEISELAAEFNDMADRLQTTEDARRRFVSDASHELKTPLAGIRLLSDSILQTENMDAQTVREFVGDIEQESERLARITENLLRLTRLDSGMLPEAQRVDLSSVMARVVRMLRLVAEEKQVDLSYEIRREGQTLASEDEIHEIIYNLTENAIKYNRPGGFVKLLLAGDEKDCLLTVSDNGIGIPEGDMPRIFDRFYRVDKMRSRAAGGTGLGLSIAADTARRRGGSIEVRAREGGGTVFTVRLPRCEEGGDET